MADIFISYGHADKAWARALAGILAERNWTVWWDHDIPPRWRFRTVIANELKKARCVVVLWSPASAASEFVASEAARGRGKLVSVLIEETEIPVGFDERQAVSLVGIEPGSVTPEVEQLIATIAAVLEQPAPPAEPYPRRYLLNLALLAAAAIGTGAWLQYAIRPQLDGRLFVAALIGAAALCAFGVYLVATRKRSRRVTWGLAAAIAILIGAAWLTPPPLYVVRLAPGKNLFRLYNQTSSDLVVSVYRNGVPIVERKPVRTFETIYLGADTEDVQREIERRNGDEEHQRRMRAYLDKATEEQIRTVTNWWTTRTDWWKTPALRRSDEIRVELRDTKGKVLQSGTVVREPGDAVATFFLERP